MRAESRLLAGELRVTLQAPRVVPREGGNGWTSVGQFVIRDLLCGSLRGAGDKYKHPGRAPRAKKPPNMTVFSMQDKGVNQANPQP